MLEHVTAGDRSVTGHNHKPCLGGLSTTTYDTRTLRHFVSTLAGDKGLRVWTRAIGARAPIRVGPRPSALALLMVIRYGSTSAGRRLRRPSMLVLWWREDVLVAVVGEA